MCPNLSSKVLKGAFRRENVFMCSPNIGYLSRYLSELRNPTNKAAAPGTGPAASPGSRASTSWASCSRASRAGRAETSSPTAARSCSRASSRWDHFNESSNSRHFATSNPHMWQYKYRKWILDTNIFILWCLGSHNSLLLSLQIVL